MGDRTRVADAQIMQALDRIRDSTLEMESMCRQFCEYLEEQLGFAEVHILVRNRDSGALENPAPSRAMSHEVQELAQMGGAFDPGDPAHPGSMEARPLNMRGRDMGMLILRYFGKPDAEMSRAADAALTIVDSAVEHALNFAELRDRNRELKAVFDLDRLRDLQLPFDQMIGRTAEKILEYIQADAAAVILYNQASQTVDIRLPDRPGCASFGEPDCLASLRDLTLRSFKMRTLISAERIHPMVGSALCIPLILGDSIIGAFVVVRRERRPFATTDRRLLAAMASQIDTAIFEDRQHRRIKDVFKRYVSDAVVEEMLKSGQEFLKGQRRCLSVLFSDLRGFTAMSERLDTDTVVRMLNQHLDAMTEVVLSNSGTLDKFIGDSVMAFWGAPVEQPQHAWMAIKTALEMRAAHQTLMQHWQAHDPDPISLGIGIDTGDMFVGNIGNERKSSYTVIGDHVNLAARLEGVAQGGQILISHHTLELVRDRITVEALEPVRLKGKAEPVPVFNVLSLKT